MRMELTNISADASNSAIGVDEPIGGSELERERALPETMIHRSMPNHASAAAPFHSAWQLSAPGATSSTSQAAAAIMVSPSVYYPYPNIGMGMGTADIGGDLLVNHHLLGMDPTSHSGPDPASSRIIHDLPTSPITPKGVNIHANDVLCGRGGHINSHPGNLVFRDWVAERKEAYVLATSKAEKSRITLEIFHRVLSQNPPGRFLRKIASRDGGKSTSLPYSLSGCWVEIDNTKALAKCSQALREGAPEYRAQRAEVPSLPSQKTNARQKQKQKEEEEEWLFPSHAKRKKPPPEPLGMERMQSSTAQEASSMSSRTTSPGGLRLFPQDYVGHYTAPVDQVAQGIASHQTTKILSPDLPGVEKTSGKWSSPKLLPSTNTGPFVSPGISPSADARLAMDAMTFLPDFVQTDANPTEMEARLYRGHSLSSNDEIYSVGSFNDPFANDSNGNNHKRERSRSSSKSDHKFKSNHSSTKR